MNGFIGVANYSKRIINFYNVLFSLKIFKDPGIKSNFEVFCKFFTCFEV